MGTRRLMGLNRTPLAVCVAAAFATGLAVASGVVIAGTPGQPDPSGETQPAAVLPVTSCADDGSPGTLREVVAGAASGDTVDLTQLTCSQITLLSGQIEVQADDLTINGPGADSLTLDGNQQSNYDYINPTYDGRVFYHNGVGTLTINSVTVANGFIYDFQSYGGCIHSKNGGVALSDAVVMGCRARGVLEVRGGGISAKTLIALDRATISENKAITSGNLASFSSGGGVFSAAGDVTINDSFITDNRAEASYETNIDHTQASGGGISAYFGETTISGSVISNNFAGCDTSILHCHGGVGGGIRSEYNLTLIETTVSDNLVEAEGDLALVGGGIYQASGDLVVVNSKVTGNRIQGPPGAIPIGGGIVAGSGIVSIAGSTISDNTSSYIAGGMWLFAQQSTIVNSTISGNIAEGGTYGNGYAGGIRVTNGPLLLRSVTITLNESHGNGGGGGIVDTHSGEPSNFESSIIAGNIITAATPLFDADLGVQVGTITGANNLIVAASGVALPPDTLSTDPLLGPLQDNGGLTWTHALLTGSPAIDAGNNAANLDFDQRGEGYPRVSGFVTDIGAFEVQQDPVGSPPDAADDNYTTVEDTALTVDPPGVLGNDSDPDGDPLTAAPVSGPSNGELTLNPDGSFTYTPNDDFVGTDSFTYEANDGQLDSNVATVTIEINPVNQAPVAANDSYTTAENATLTVNAPGVLGNDSDPDGDPLVAAPVTGPSNGELTLNPDGSFVYTPAAGFSGKDSFQYEVSDGTLDSNIATVTIKISHVDQPPSAADDSYATAENAVLKISAPGVLGNDSDPDGDTLTAVLVSGTSNGTLAMNPDGSFIYVPAGAFSGTDSFTYEANGGQLGSNVATVTITVKQDPADTVFADGFDGP